MAEYFWNPSLMRHVFAVPEEIVDRHLRLAREDHLKVLLWVSRNGLFDAEACERATGVLASNCVDALQYWVAAGVLSGGEPVAATPTPPKDEIPPAPKPKAAARPKVHKPQLTEVIRRQQQDGEFDGLLAEVSARMGRPLGNGDLETLLYLYESVGLPAAVILMVVGYAAQMGRINMRYIEKVALDWADRDVLTIAAAEEHLCRLERSQQALRHVQTVCGLDKPPTGAAAFAAAEKWIYDWNTPDDILRQAYEVCCQKVGKFQAGYMTRVLENWREQGADTVQRIADLSADSKKAGKKAAPDSEYETMVEQYIPVYKKKKKG